MIIFSSIGGLTLLSFLLLPPRSNAFVSRGNSVLPHIKANRIVDTTVIGGEKPSTGRLFGKWENYDHSDHDGSSYEDALARNKARTDVRNFLTQRAIQSFIFLLDQCRDPHTIAWVEDAMDCKNIGSFHGTGAFNLTIYPTWEAPLVDLVSRSKETVIVRKRRTRKSHGGWSNNSYLDRMGGGGTSNIPKKNNDDNPTPKNYYKPASHFLNNNYLESMNNANTNNDKNSGDGDTIEAKTIDDSTVRKSQKKTKKKKKKRSKRTTTIESKNADISGGKSKIDPVLEEARPTMENEISGGGKSTSNPYLEEVFVDYEIDIDPTSIVSRIISVREQIATEWKQDLETMIETNNYVLQTYLTEQTESRSAERETSSSSSSTTTTTIKDEVDDDQDNDEDNDDEEEPSLETLTAPYSSNDDSEIDKTPVIVFDRNAMAMLTNTMGSQDRDSSPLRRSNFDLLLLLCTQESIHRVLRSYREEDRVESLAWLRDFYISRVSEYFDGHNQRRGRGDLFLEELLLATPSMVRKDNELHLIDPLRMAEDIIRERSRVAGDWKELVAQTTSDHIEIRRILLAKMMGNDFDPMTSMSPSSSSKSSKTAEAKALDLFEAGGFE